MSPNEPELLVFSTLKRRIIGTWQRVSAKHLAACLDEMTWRYCYSLLVRKKTRRLLLPCLRTQSTSRVHWALHRTLDIEDRCLSSTKAHHDHGSRSGNHQNRRT